MVFRQREGKMNIWRNLFILGPIQIFKVLIWQDLTFTEFQCNHWQPHSGSKSWSREMNSCCIQVPQLNQGRVEWSFLASFISWTRPLCGQWNAHEAEIRVLHLPSHRQLVLPSAWLALFASKCNSICWKEKNHDQPPLISRSKKCC